MVVYLSMVLPYEWVYMSIMNKSDLFWYYVDIYPDHHSINVTNPPLDVNTHTSRFHDFRSPMRCVENESRSCRLAIEQHIGCLQFLLWSPSSFGSDYGISGQVNLHAALHSWSSTLPVMVLTWSGWWVETAISGWSMHISIFCCGRSFSFKVPWIRGQFNWQKSQRCWSNYSCSLLLELSRLFVEITVDY